MKKALVLGGGFAGIQAAIELQKSKKFEVTLISDREYFYIYPVSIWIPVRKKKFDDVSVDLQAIANKHNFKAIVDPVLSIKAGEHLVVCKDNSYEFDYLLIATGAGKMSHKGIENTLSICGKPEYSISIMEKLDTLVSAGKGTIAVGFGGNPMDMSAVRGGPAFEFIFNVDQMLRRKGIRDNFELIFFAPMAEPGSKMGKNAVPMINRMFKASGIKKQYGLKIKEFGNGSVIFEDDSVINADLIMFIPASSKNPMLTVSDLPLSQAGFIKIDDNCKAEGFSDVYAIGDIAAIEGPDWISKQGHMAEIMGRNAAFNIIQSETGSSKRKGYKKELSILCVMDTGNGAAFVSRNEKRSFIIPMPLAGHWLKMVWGWYAKTTKTTAMPRIPGL
jgi:sulfide:quinone oxidoreductase